MYAILVVDADWLAPGFSADNIFSDLWLKLGSIFVSDSDATFWERDFLHGKAQAENQ